MRVFYLYRKNFKSSHVYMRKCFHDSRLGNLDSEYRIMLNARITEVSKFIIAASEYAAANLLISSRSQKRTLEIASFNEQSATVQTRPT